MDIDKIVWSDITSETKKWLRGWIAVMCKDLSQKIIWHEEIDDTMLFYYILPSYLTREQFEKTDAGKEIKVNWDYDRFIVS